ncbi:MAG: sulfotransferase family 2 domain-containing protein [Ardenticatenaceae bacterium]|nr:sulfotransferase family 2 domain-containing protein [Ardenticatenaceae bacterium]
MTPPTFNLEPPPLYYAHIPKTGGTSLFVFLRDSYGRRHTFPSLTRQEFLSYQPEARHSYRLFVGHWGTDIHTLLPPKTLWMTILRDPVEQLMSWFYHMHHVVPRYPQHYAPLARWQPIIENDLQAAMADSFITSQLTNQQTRFLATAVHYAPFANTGDWELYDDHTRTAASLENLAQHALTNLAHMSLVSVTERFNDTIQLLCHRLGLIPPWVRPVYNLNKQRQQMSPVYYRRQLAPDLLRQVEALVRYDLDLYATARQRLNTQLAETDFSRRVWAIRPFFRQILYSTARGLWQPFHPRRTRAH